MIPGTRDDLTLSISSHPMSRADRPAKAMTNAALCPPDSEECLNVRVPILMNPLTRHQPWEVAQIVLQC